jgi:hypothetical protein
MLGEQMSDGCVFVIGYWKYFGFLEIDFESKYQ